MKNIAAVLATLQPWSKDIAAALGGAPTLSAALGDLTALPAAFTTAVAQSLTTTQAFLTKETLQSDFGTQPRPAWVGVVVDHIATLLGGLSPPPWSADIAAALGGAPPLSAALSDLTALPAAFTTAVAQSLTTTQAFLTKETL